MDRRGSGQGVYAPLGWDNLPGRSTRLLRLEWGEGRWTVTVQVLTDQVEGGGDNGQPDRTGSHPRYAVTEVFICAVVVLASTPRDLISHLFTATSHSSNIRDRAVTSRTISYPDTTHIFFKNFVKNKQYLLQDFCRSKNFFALK
jgi:hypothetical protein